MTSFAMLCVGFLLGLMFGPAKERLESAHVDGFIEGYRAASHPLEQQQAVSGDVVERVSQQIANAMQRARDECGGDRVSFAYAEAAMRSELRAALTASGMGRMRSALEYLLSAALAVNDDNHCVVDPDAIREARTALQEGVE